MSSKHILAVLFVLCLNIIYKATHLPISLSCFHLHHSYRAILRRDLFSYNGSLPKSETAHRQKLINALKPGA